MYKDTNQNPYSAGVICGDTQVTQAEATKANEYSKYLRYVLNFKNTQVRGVNAQYNVLSGEDASLRAQVAAAVLSIKAK